MAVRVAPGVRKIRFKGQMNAVITNGSKRVILDITTRQNEIARQIAPRGKTTSFFPKIPKSGRLRDKHRIILPVKINSRLWRGRLRNDAPYAIYVHNGTRGPITMGQANPANWGAFGQHATTGGAYWHAKGAPAKDGIYFAKQVSGQVGNPWLVRAYNMATLQSPYTDRVRPMLPPARVIKGVRGTRSDKIDPQLAPRRIRKGGSLYLGT